jgi:DNA polymerase
MCRGKIPCDVLFIGEAPGASEDVIGQPFIGPAGKLLDQQIAEAQANAKTNLRLCFTNLVCCIPKKDGRKIGEPDKECIKACNPRLLEFISLARPTLIVCVGDLADKYVGETEGLLDTMGRAPRFTEITHPAAILRAEVVRKPLMNQRVVVTLENEFREM